jgi:4-amino-4-deoxy-L-arabinose transferase-like glycosyltransferase
MFNHFRNLFDQPVFRYATALFIFSLTVNLVFFNWTEAPIIYPDSHGYIKPAVQLKQGRLPDFSLRSPTYPMYLVVMGFFGKIVNGSPLKLAVYGQILLGAIAIVLLYLTCLELLKSERLAFAVAVLLSLNFQVINYQSAVLTETLATTLLMAVLYAHIAALHRKITLKRLCGMVTVDALLVMLRPNFVLLPSTLYVLHVLYILANSGTRAGRADSASRSISFVVLGVSCNLALVATWGTFFFLHTGYVGLSRTSDFNLLGKAIQYGYLDQHYPNPPRIVQRTHEIYRQVERNQDPYSVINPLRTEGLYSMGNLRSINSYFLGGRSVDFVIKTVQLLPVVLNKRSPFSYGRPNGSQQNPWLQRIFRGFDLLNTLNGKAIVFAGGLALYLLIKNRREQVIALIMILSTVFYHLVAITAFGYSEYPRLRSPIDLLLNVLVLLPLLLLALAVGSARRARCRGPSQERTV